MISEMAQSAPYFQFYTDVVEDREASEENGRYTEKDVDCIRLTPKGGKSVVEDRYDEWLLKKSKLAKQGQYDPGFVEHVERAYAKWKDGQETPLEGTPIKGWSAVSAATQHNIINANIKTVEDLATATEEGLTNIGMGARDLQRKAQAFLAASEDAGKVAIENANLKLKVEEMEGTIADMKAVIDELKKDTPKRGRKAA